MTWLSDIEAEGKIEYEDSERMVPVIKELVWFIGMNIDFDSPIRPVGISNLSSDTMELIIKIEE